MSTVVLLDPLTRETTERATAEKAMPGKEDEANKKKKPFEEGEI